MPRLKMRVGTSDLLELGMIVLILGILGLFIGCAEVKRPDADACWVNAAGGYKRCYNLLKDYDKDGTRLPDAKPKDVPISTLADINGNLVFDALGQKEVKRFINQSNKEFKDLKERCGIFSVRKVEVE